VFVLSFKKHSLIPINSYVIPDMLF